MSRRAFLIGAASGALLGASASVARGQPAAVRVGALHPVTGPFADVGAACRMAARIAVEAVNEAGGIVSLNGAHVELLVGDAEAGAAAEAERLFNAGARVLTGAFHSGYTAAAAAVARRRGLPFLVDSAIADAVVLPVVSGERPVVFRNFPTTTMFARRALQYVGEIFAEASRPLARATVLYSTDPLGTTQARRLEAAHTLLRPSFVLTDSVPISPRATTVGAEVTKLRDAAPDVVFLAVRRAVLGPLFTHLARAPLQTAAIVSLGTPDLPQAAQEAGVGPIVERVMELAPWPNLRNVRTQRLVHEYVTRAGGRPLDAVAGYAHEAQLVISAALERARSAEAAALTDAIRRTTLDDPLMVATGPVVFDAAGENPNASPALLQVSGGRPFVVWPRNAAERRVVLASRMP